MPPEATQTGEQKPAPTGGEVTTPPAATQPQGSSTATGDDDGFVRIPKADYDKMISKRDQTNEQRRQESAFVNQLAWEREADDFLNDPENKKKFPDVVRNDLLGANSDEDFATLANTTQDRIVSATNKRIATIQTAGAPQLTPEQISEQEKLLKANPGKRSFMGWMKLKGV